MKYGFLFDRYRDCINLLYILNNGELSTDYEFFTISLGEDTFVFARDKTLLSDCDKVIKVTHTFDTIEHNTNSIFVLPGESIPTVISDERLTKFLENNMVIMGATVGFENENFLSDFRFNLHALYHHIGYEFLNYYKQREDKEHLLGLYYSPTHISGRTMRIRDCVYDIVTDVLGDKVHVYERKQSKFSSVTVPYRFMGIWESIHITSYTDYVTSVCNVVYETNAVTENTIPEREHMTEKTLKALLFSQVDMFTIWIGSPKQYKFLVDNGFWMLNFEFMDESIDFIKSAELTAQYLKQLYDELGSNQLVFKFLMDKYADKLKQNSKNIQMLIEQCPEEVTNKVLKFIKR